MNNNKDDKFNVICIGAGSGYYSTFIEYDEEYLAKDGSISIMYKIFNLNGHYIGEFFKTRFKLKE